MRRIFSLPLCGFLLSSIGWGANIGFGIKGGLVSPEDYDATFTLGGLVDFVVTPQFSIDAGIDFWPSSYEEYNIESDVTDIALYGTAKYVLPLQGAPIKIFLGGGLGIHIFSWETTVDYGYGYSESEEGSDTEIGFHFSGGIEKPISPTMSLFGELKFALVDPCDQLYITGGLIFALPTATQ